MQGRQQEGSDRRMVSGAKGRGDGYRRRIVKRRGGVGKDKRESGNRMEGTSRGADEEANGLTGTSAANCWAWS
jgi:hypothetical protein